MLMISQDDIAAVHRAREAGDLPGALAEARRRWPVISDEALPGFIDRILRMPPDPAPFAGKKQARRDGPESPRSRQP